MATKTCRACNAAKPLDAFHRQRKGAGGRRATCRDCRRAHPDLGAEAVRWRNIRLRYGLSREEYEAMGTTCHICGGTPTDRALAVDHDHETGVVRGLLCGWCNRAVGYMADNPARLRAAADYLEGGR